MRSSIVRSLCQGIRRYKNVPCSRAIPGLGNSQTIRSVRMAHSMTQGSSYIADEIHEMMALWPDIVRDVTEGLPYNDVPMATKWMAEVLHYNVPKGKKHRALCVIGSYRMLVPPEKLTNENLKLVRISGWCSEIIQATLQMQDDIIDHSSTRRGYPCWYLCENVGVRAINDSFLVEHAAYQLVKRYFSNHESYAVLLEFTMEMILQVALGQVMDISSSKLGHSNLETYTKSRYDAVTKYRGSLFFIVNPVKIAMLFAGITDPEMYRYSEPILLDMGHLYTVQNDYFDCFGDAGKTGHIGNDIEQGKCSWCIVTALERATPAQRKVLEECYGIDDPEKAARVKRVYNDLDLPTIYANYEENAYNFIKTRINQTTCDFPKDLFDEVLALFYRRRA